MVQSMKKRLTMNDLADCANVLDSAGNGIGYMGSSRSQKSYYSLLVEILLRAEQ